VGGKNLHHEKMWHSYSKKMFTDRAKPIWLKGDPDNLRPDRWRSNVCGTEKCIHIKNIINGNCDT
jgi:hypothetical protein